MDYISKFPRRRISQRSTCRYNAPSWTLVAKSVWLGTLPESALTGPLLSPCRSSDLTSQGFQMQEHTHTQGFMFLHRRWEGSLSCFPQHFPKMLEVSKRVCGARTGQEEQEFPRAAQTPTPLLSTRTTVLPMGLGKTWCFS